jgi:transglutaminase-like putative cysteine protease
MRFKVTHTTTYTYTEPASKGINLAYLLPRDTHRQTCESRRLEIHPSPATSLTRVDYFGNHAVHFTVEEPHTTFNVEAISNVEVGAASVWPESGTANSCRQVLERLATSTEPEDLLAREYRLASPLIGVNPKFAAFAAPFFSDERPFLLAVSEFSEHIFKEFTFDPDFSDVSTPLQHVLQHRKGVCQDFAQLAIASLRSLGYPTRYISGYLETLPPPGKEKLVGSDASHAWFAVYSPGEGWFEFDPTNNLIPAEQHIITAWGRDYSDVTPLRGVVMGGGKEHKLDVSVDVMRR